MIKFANIFHITNNIDPATLIDLLLQLYTFDTKNSELTLYVNNIKLFKQSFFKLEANVNKRTLLKLITYMNKNINIIEVPKKYYIINNRNIYNNVMTKDQAYITFLNLYILSKMNFNGYYTHLDLVVNKNLPKPIFFKTHFKEYYMSTYRSKRGDYKRLKHKHIYFPVYLKFNSLIRQEFKNINISQILVTKKKNPNYEYHDWFKQFPKLKRFTSGDSIIKNGFIFNKFQDLGKSGYYHYDSFFKELCLGNDVEKLFKLDNEILKFIKDCQKWRGTYETTIKKKIN